MKNTTPHGLTIPRAGGLALALSVLALLMGWRGLQGLLG